MLFPGQLALPQTPNLQIPCFKKAIEQLDPSEHPLVHSDRGCHYRWPEWINLMDTAGLTRSMSKKGCSPDNSACEGFFGRLKNEMFYGMKLESMHLLIHLYIN